MKKNTILILLTICCFNIVIAQNNPKPNSNFWKHVQFGGGITLDFTNRTTNLGIAPSAIYNFNKKISAGISVSYLYSKHKDFSNPINSFGGSVISLYNPFNGLQISGEYEHTYLTSQGISRDVPALFFGAGYTARRNIAIGLRYDVLYSETKSLYSSALTPFVRIYF